MILFLTMCIDKYKAKFTIGNAKYIICLEEFSLLCRSVIIWLPSALCFLSAKYDLSPSLSS